MSLRFKVCCHAFGFFLLSLFLTSCSTREGLFKKRSPHQIYSQRLKEAGLDKTAMGRAWLTVADRILRKPLVIAIPYKETGYFAADRVQAASFRFEAQQGEKLTITLNKKPLDNFNIYVDLVDGDSPSAGFDVLAFADSTNNDLMYDVDDSGFYLLRLQPELLRSGEYTLTITRGPSLAYPIKASGISHIQSFWGDARTDYRKHEGIDLFASFRTPVVAAAAGVISGVRETNLGGKVVWLKPKDKNYRLYYAHLDTQLVTNGQRVKLGDTLGLMGNTGNARSTPPHLHFGIYTFNGAVNPFPFVNRNVMPPATIKAPLVNLNSTVRTNVNNTRFYSSPVSGQSVLQTLPVQTTLLVEAASGDMYKATLPSGITGYISSRYVDKVNEPLRKYNLSAEQPLLSEPFMAAARKAVLSSGKPVNILGGYEDYYLVSDDDGVMGWIKK